MKLQDLLDSVTGTATAVATHFGGMDQFDIALSLLLSGVVVTVVLLLQKVLAGLLRRLAGKPATGSEVSFNPDRVVRLSIFLLKTLVWAAMVAGVLLVWGFDVVEWLSTGLGERVLEGIGRVSLLIVVGFLAYEIAGLAITRAFERLATRSADLRRAAQLRTVRPIIIGVVQTAIVVMAIMLTLSELGINVGPLIAGAGIVGIAVGFGAQTLVKDFITGVFLIMEDILSVGDVVEIGGFGGTVEAMTFRTVRLRDLAGTLHIFPYSEAQIIHNRTNLFAYAIFDLSIGYASSVEKAVEAILTEGAALRADPDFAGDVTADMEVLGVDRLADSGVTLKARIRTLPGKQWRVQREFNRRIKIAFQREGVDIPYPHMQLVLPGMTGLEGAAAGPAAASKSRDPVSDVPELDP